MQTITEMMNKQEVKVIEKPSMKWTDRADSAANEIQKMVNSDEVHEYVIKAYTNDIALFYENPANARKKYRRTLEVEGYVTLQCPESSADLDKLLKAYRSAGCTTGLSWDTGLGMTVVRISYNIEIQSRKASETFNVSDYISKNKPKVYVSWRKIDKDEYGNGYNDLDGRTITEYRDKLLKAYKGMTVKIWIGPAYMSSAYLAVKVQGMVSHIDVAYVKKLTKEFTEDPVIKKASERLDIVSRGIADYYAEKRARGDHYTGD